MMIVAGALVDVILCFFFFQAEDGIRDLTVTGVQTCALPILDRLESHGGQPAGWRHRGAVRWQPDLARRWRIVGLHRSPARSEERRVGKECRSRWSPYH